MSLDHLLEYLFPIAILIFYFFIHARKKKEAPKAHPKKEEFRPEPPRRASVQQKPEVFTQRSEYNSSVDIVSKEMQSYAVEDSYDPHKKKGTTSKAQKLLKGHSLRSMVIIKEIFDRPYD
jgi:hypothetical protein